MAVVPINGLGPIVRGTNNNTQQSKYRYRYHYCHKQARSRGGRTTPPPQLPFPKILFHPLAWGPIKVTIPSSYRWKYAPLWLINHCECPRVGVFFNFLEGGWRHVDNVQGGVLVNVFFTPPSGNPVFAPVFHLSKFRPPPHLDGWLQAW